MEGLGESVIVWSLGAVVFCFGDGHCASVVFYHCFDGEAAAAFDAALIEDPLVYPVITVVDVGQLGLLSIVFRFEDE